MVNVTKNSTVNVRIEFFKTRSHTVKCVTVLYGLAGGINSIEITVNYFFLPFIIKWLEIKLKCTYQFCFAFGVLLLSFSDVHLKQLTLHYAQFRVELWRQH